VALRQALDGLREPLEAGGSPSGQREVEGRRGAPRDVWRHGGEVHPPRKLALWIGYLLRMLDVSAQESGLDGRDGDAHRRVLCQMTHPQLLFEPGLLALDLLRDGGVGVDDDNDMRVALPFEEAERARVDPWQSVLAP